LGSRVGIYVLGHRIGHQQGVPATIGIGSIDCEKYHNAIADKLVGPSAHAFDLDSHFGEIRVEDEHYIIRETLFGIWGPT
jgi:hypothetical protein